MQGPGTRDHHSSGAHEGGQGGGRGRLQDGAPCQDGEGAGRESFGQVRCTGLQGSLVVLCAVEA